MRQMLKMILCKLACRQNIFTQMPYGAQPHRDEGCSASVIEMIAEQCKKFNPGPEPLVLFLSYCCFWLNYSSVPWIRLADITRFRTRMKFMNWTFKVVLLFSYQVSALLSHSVRKLLYFIIIAFICQELFLISNSSIIFIQDILQSQATFRLYHILNKCQEKFCNHRRMIAKTEKKGFEPLRRY